MRAKALFYFIKKHKEKENHNENIDSNEREHELSFGIAFIREDLIKFCSNDEWNEFRLVSVLRCISWTETQQSWLTSFRPQLSRDQDKLSEKDIEKWLEDKMISMLSSMIFNMFRPQN